MLIVKSRVKWIKITSYRARGTSDRTHLERHDTSSSIWYKCNLHHNSRRQRRQLNHYGTARIQIARARDNIAISHHLQEEDLLYINSATSTSYFLHVRGGIRLTGTKVTKRTRAPFHTILFSCVCGVVWCGVAVRRRGSVCIGKKESERE